MLLDNLLLWPEPTCHCRGTHELIKLSVLKNCPDDPKELGITIAERTHSELVQVIGKKFILYKPFKDNPVIILPKERKED